MRARGAEATDIVVLVVAADDGVMPQTIEAINHAKAAEVPIVVAINKIDREQRRPAAGACSSSPSRASCPSRGAATRSWSRCRRCRTSASTTCSSSCSSSPRSRTSPPTPTGRAKGVVLEANLDVGRGPVATVLVDKGTLKVGDPIVAGAAWGTVRALIDDQGEQVKEAGPSTPVQVLGLSTVPGAGDEFRGRPRREDGQDRRRGPRAARSGCTNQRGRRATSCGGVKLEDIFEQIQKGEAATLNLIAEGRRAGLARGAHREPAQARARRGASSAFVHRGVGGITENDITLAATTNATIIGFNVRPDRKARELADAEDVEIRTYEIIYQVLEDIENAMVGMLAPEFEEVVTGEAEVREIFRVPRVGAHRRLLRASAARSPAARRSASSARARSSGRARSRRCERFKDDVREVAAGFECGIGLSDFQDLKQGDIIETFEEREIPRT